VHFRPKAWSCQGATVLLENRCPVEVGTPISAKLFVFRAVRLMAFRVGVETPTFMPPIAA
jgi:hypothetical protein